MAATGSIQPIPDGDRARMMDRLIREGEERAGHQADARRVQFEAPPPNLEADPIPEEDMMPMMEPTPDLRRRLIPRMPTEVPPEDAFFLPPGELPADPNGVSRVMRYVISGGVGLLTAVLTFFLL